MVKQSLNQKYTFTEISKCLQQNIKLILSIDIKLENVNFQSETSILTKIIILLWIEVNVYGDRMHTNCANDVHIIAGNVCHPMNSKYKLL